MKSLSIPWTVIHRKRVGTTFPPTYVVNFTRTEQQEVETGEEMILREGLDGLVLCIIEGHPAILNENFKEED